MMMIYFISSGCLRAGSCRRTGITQWTAQETKPTSRAATWDDRCWPTTHVATASPWWWAACQAEPLLQPPYLATGKPSDMRWVSDLFVCIVQFQVFRLGLEVEFVLTKKKRSGKVIEDSETHLRIMHWKKMKRRMNVVGIASVFQSLRDWLSLTGVFIIFSLCWFISHTLAFYGNSIKLAKYSVGNVHEHDPT